MGESANPTLTLRFVRRLRVEFRGATLTADAGLLAARELDDTSDKCGAFGLRLTGMATTHLKENRTGRKPRTSETRSAASITVVPCVVGYILASHGVYGHTIIAVAVAR